MPKIIVSSEIIVERNFNSPPINENQMSKIIVGCLVANQEGKETLLDLPLIQTNSNSLNLL